MFEVRLVDELLIVTGLGNGSGKKHIAMAGNLWQEGHGPILERLLTEAFEMGAAKSSEPIVKHLVISHMPNNDHLRNDIKDDDVIFYSQGDKQAEILDRFGRDPSVSFNKVTFISPDPHGPHMGPRIAEAVMKLILLDIQRIANDLKPILTPDFEMFVSSQTDLSLFPGFEGASLWFHKEVNLSNYLEMRRKT